jgi:hypothetical protein
VAVALRVIHAAQPIGGGQLKEFFQRLGDRDLWNRHAAGDRVDDFRDGGALAQHFGDGPRTLQQLVNRAGRQLGKGHVAEASGFGDFPGGIVLPAGVVRPPVRERLPPLVQLGLERPGLALGLSARVGFQRDARKGPRIDVLESGRHPLHEDPLAPL